MRQGVARGDVAPCPADDDRQFALVVELVGKAGLPHRRFVPDEAVCEPGEHRWMGGQFAAGLGHVAAVVQADTQDLARRGHRRQQPQPGQGPTGHADRLRRLGDLFRARLKRSGHALRPA
ncbi:hypothetical protein G6F68_018801 [Rhizopus microsporus]|nr:hypothetical protein G6F68_018801 [Rhizopus microsporus]